MRAFIIGRFTNKMNHRESIKTKSASFLETFSLKKGIQNLEIKVMTKLTKRWIRYTN